MITRNEALREAARTVAQLNQVTRLLSEVMAQVDAAQANPGKVGFVVSSELRQWWRRQKEQVQS